jgi:hypothetical protein
MTLSWSQQLLWKRLRLFHNTVSRRQYETDNILNHLQAELRSRIEVDIPKIIACLFDSSDRIREAALEGIGALAQYCG